MISRVLKPWKDTAELEKRYREFVRMMMIVPPAFLVLILVPTPGLWGLGDARGSWRDMWTSGAFVSAAILLAGWTAGFWGFAARIAPARWAAVVAPLLSSIFFPMWLDSPVSSYIWTIFMSFSLYWVLFRTRGYNEYLTGSPKPLCRTPNRSW